MTAFWPAEWVASGTATLDYRPSDHVAFMVEFRHDQAEGDAYFEGDATAPNTDSQDTVTLGATAWF